MATKTKTKKKAPPKKRAKKTTARKASAKKATAKKTPAKRTAAKKAAAKKAPPKRGRGGKTGLAHPLCPAVGKRLTRLYQGQRHIVQVTEEGFRYKGKVYASLSRIAHEITGSTWNGWLFFGLKGAA